MKKLILVVLSLVLLVSLVGIVACDETPVDCQHEYGDWVITKEATCLEAGSRQRVCSKDSTHIQREEIAKLPHTEVDIPAKEATCLEEGSTAGKECSVCDTVIVAPTVIAKLPHTEVDIPAKEATCLEEGSTAGKECSVCDTVIVAPTTIAKLPHTPVAIGTAVPATCTATGKTAGSKCSVCEEVLEEQTTVPMLAHAYGDWSITTAPTLAATGQAQRACANCSDVDTVVLAVLSDTTVWTLTTVPATINNAGSHTYSSEYGDVVLPIAKLSAPYDNKTYSGGMAYEYKADATTGAQLTASWSGFSVAFDANNVGTADRNFLFGNVNIIEVLDATTGRVKLTQQVYKTESVPIYAPDAPEEFGGEPIGYETVIVRDDNGNPIVVDTMIRYGYYSPDGKFLVLTTNSDGSFDYVMILNSMSATVGLADTTVSAWSGGMAITIVIDSQSYNIFVDQDRAYFGVSFVDADDVAIQADQCYSSALVVVKDSNGNAIETYAHNGQALVPADGHQGEYQYEDVTILLNGTGIASIADTKGTYTVVDGLGIEILVDNNYYLLADGVVSKPTVEITFDAGEYATVEAMTVNAKTDVTLPVPTNDTHLFMGWYLDANCTQSVVDWKPTQDTTLYAKWSAKTVININGVLEGDASTIYVGAGATIGDYLPQYTSDATNKKLFAGWFLDAVFNTPLSLDAAVPESAEPLNVYAKWDDFAVYVGTYHGNEVYGKNSSSTSIGVSIDEFGVVTYTTYNWKGEISSQKTGKVASYDADSGALTYTINTATYYCVYHHDTRVMLHMNSKDTSTGSDFYFLAESMTAGSKVEEGYAVYSPKTQADNTFDGYNVRFVTYPSNDASKTVIVWNNKLYDNYSLTDAYGVAIADVAGVKTATTLVIRDLDAVDGDNIILAIASHPEIANIDSSSNSKKPTMLDQYFGTYTIASSQDTVQLSGAGGIRYQGDDGTYTVDNNGLVCAYIGDSYYEITVDLSTKTYTIVKPMVDITYNTDGKVAIDSVNVNKNIAIALPQPTHADFVFRGWYSDEGFGNKVDDNYIPTASCTLYAKWLTKYTLTVVYGNGMEQVELVYGEGETTAPVEPQLTNNKIFEGWYTDDAFLVPYTPGAIQANTTIHCKWKDPVAQHGTYKASDVNGSNANGGTFSGSTVYNPVTVDPYGNVKYGNTTATIEGVTTGTGEAWYVKSATDRGFGYYNHEEGLWIFNPYDKTATSYADRILIAVKGATTVNVEGCYWDAGKIKLMTITVDKDLDSTRTINVYLAGTTFYTGVTYVGADNLKDVYKQDVVITDANGQMIAKFFHDGSKLCLSDGTDGTYTGDTYGDIVLNGIGNVTVGGVKGTCTKAVEGASYGYDVYVDGVYYELTIDVEAKTYVMTKPMVDIIFVGDKVVVDSVNVNKNIAIALTQPTHADFVFRGWYSDEGFGNKVDDNYIPTADCTLYAKWDAKVILTVVYGNGLESVDLVYGVGDTTAPVPPAFKDGKVFEGWYTDTSFATPYEVGVISANTTIYCNWKEAIALYGTYKGSNVFGVGENSGHSGGTFNKDLSISATGEATGSEKAQINSYDVATKVFKGTLAETTGDTLSGLFDLSSGVLVFNYSGKSSSTLDNDIWIYVKDASSVTIKTGSSCRWNGGLSKIMTLVVDAGEDTAREINLLIHDNKIYSGVTVEGAAMNEVYNATDVVVKDSAGNVVFSRSTTA